MKRLTHFMVILLTGVLLTQCAVTGSYTEEAPQSGKSILVGAILVENFGIGDMYDFKKSNISVKIAGKFTNENGEEVTETYRVMTDPNGYYMIQNVEPGSYIIKGIEVNLVPNERTYVRAIWDGERRYYELTDQEGDFTVRYWPPEVNQKIIDLGIMQFELGITSRGHVLYQRFTELTNARLRLPGITYNMDNPVEYYSEKFPEWSWFNN